MKDKLFISVIVPVYNGEKMIGRCIESLLTQDYPQDRYEVIVVDNDSTDRTADTIKQYPVQYVLENRIHTSYAARNAGARAAQGEALAFCDADQIAARPWLQNLLSKWEDKRYGAFAGEVVPETTDGSFLSRYAAAFDEGLLSAMENHPRGPTASGGNVAYRREVFWQLGGFQANMPSAADLLLGRSVGSRLGLCIAYEPTALMFHRTRRTKRALLRQQMRMAYGGQDFQEHLGVLPRSVLPVTWRLLGTFARSLTVCAVRTVLPFGRDHRFRAFAAGMNALVALARLRGVLAHRWSRGRPSRTARGKVPPRAAAGA